MAVNKSYYATSSSITDKISGHRKLGVLMEDDYSLGDKAHRPHLYIKHAYSGENINKNAL
jgi:hypothetical protein